MPINTARFGAAADGSSPPPFEPYVCWTFETISLAFVVTDAAISLVFVPMLTATSFDIEPTDEPIAERLLERPENMLDLDEELISRDSAKSCAKRSSEASERPPLGIVRLNCQASGD